MYTHLEDYIYELYRSIEIICPTELNMGLIAKKLGVEIVYEKKRIFYFDNEINLTRGTSKKEWMDFGHEVCHYLRHSGSQLNMNPLFIELQECQAKNFAYHFCVPSFMLAKIDLPNDKKEAAWLISDTFNVDLPFAERRLEKLLNQRAIHLFYYDNKKERLK